MADFQRAIYVATFGGLDLVNPVDRVPQGKFCIATNIRSYQDDSIQTRPGFTALATAAGAGGSGVQSIRRLNDYEISSFTYLVMAGTKLFSGTSGALTNVSTGFSGNPMTSAFVGPYQSPRPYAYIGDPTKIGKLAVGDTALSNWGVPAPNQPPVANFAAPNYVTISDMEATTGWAVAGTASGLSNPSRINTTIAQIAYDVGTTGMCSVSLTSFANVGRGCFLILNSSETVQVMEIIPKIADTTIGAIIYDSGTTGACSISLTTPGAIRYLRKGALIRIGAAENCVVQDVSIGPDRLPSIRVVTTGARGAGDAVAGLTCVRVYAAGTFSAGQTATSKMIEASVAAGIGTITLTAAVDASKAGTRPIDTEEDEVHISILISDLTQLIEAKIYLDVDATTNDFTKNYYWKTLSPNDFVAAVANTETTLEARITRLQHKLLKAIQAGDFARAEALRQRIANKEAQLQELQDTPLDDQSVLGVSQFTELRFKTKGLFRIGGDQSRTLKDVAAAQVLINVAGSVTVDIDAWWIGGTYGADVGAVGEGYHYMVRGRSTTTGARSNWSPMTRSGLEAHRQRIAITPPTFTDPQVDKIDVARIGGSLERWKIIGSGPVATVFNDDFDDLSVLQMPDAENDEHQPWAVTDMPHTGTCNVAGSSIAVTSGSVSTNWEKFSIVIINNVAYSLSGPPTSTSRFQINENAGTLTGATFYFPSPLLAAQPLPCVWGPFGYGASGVVIFGVGDPLNPGTLYWTIGNNPDVMHSTGSLQVCSPSEKLMNGVIWEGRAFVLSSENLYEILPSFDTPAQFVTQKIASSKGLFAAYALAVAPEGIYHLYKDGIYLNGVQRVTDDLYPIFPHDGQAAIAVNGYNPPDFTATSDLRLEYDDGFLYFTFKDTSSPTARRKSFVLNTRTKAWSVDFPNPAGLTVLTYYGNEGGGVRGLLAGGLTAGGVYTVYQVTGTADDGAAISCELETPADNQGDGRITKNYGDTWIDLNSNGVAVSASIGFNQFATSPSPNPQTVSSATRDNTPVDINAGAGQLARNIGFDLTWSSASQVVYLYGYGWTFNPKTDDTFKRYTDVDDAGYMGAKFLQGVIIDANTFGQNKSVTIQGDLGGNGAWTDIATITLNHAQQSIIAYPVPVTSFASSGNIAHYFRLKINSAVDWELFRIEWKFEPEPELVTVWKTQSTNLDLPGFSFTREFYLPLLSTDTVTLKIYADNVAFTYTIPSTAGVRQRAYLVSQVMKAKYWSFEATSPAGFRPYQADLEIRAKAWGDTGEFKVFRPFGGPSRTNGGAAI